MPLPTPLPLNLALFHPGMRVAVAVSGGADSVALLRALLAAREELGLVLAVVHVHHGIRGAEADEDADFVSALAATYALPFHLYRVDTPAAARANGETIEEAARNLRYGCFDALLAARHADAVATAHTLDDQAETVLQRLIRGAWTEGLGGIHPAVTGASGAYLRPLLGVRRSEIEACLAALGQPWRNDSSNLDTAFTRNRIRRELMPLLRTYNPQVDSQLANLSAVARDEEDYWSAEMARLLPSILLPGTPVRGGGRAAGRNSAAFAIEVERLRPLAPAVRRRILRAAAARLGHSLNYDHTAALLALCGFAPATAMGPEAAFSARRGKAGPSSSGRVDLTGELRVERTPRELRFTRSASALPPPPEYVLPVPGEVLAEDYGLVFRASLGGSGAPASDPQVAVVRACRPGDRIRLQHSAARKTAKEVLERLHLSAGERAQWPLVEWHGEVVWMRGVLVDPRAMEAAGIILMVEEIESPSPLL